MPAAATMTTSSTTSGELAKPQLGTFVPVSDAALRDHTTAPSRGVERVQDSGRAERVDATVAEGRRRARTGAAIRLPEPGRVAVSPHRLAGGHACSRRRSRRRRAAPGCRGGRRGPRRTTSPVRSAGATARPAATADQSVSIRTPRTMPSRSGPRKPGQSALRLGRCRSRRGVAVGAGAGAVAGRRAAGRRRSSAVGSCSAARLPEPAAAPPARRRPGPGAVPRESASTASARSESAVAGDAAGPHERQHSAREQDGRRPSTRAEVRSERRRLATAQATKARLRTGMA